MRSARVLQYYNDPLIRSRVSEFAMKNALWNKINGLKEGVFHINCLLSKGKLFCLFQYQILFLWATNLDHCPNIYCHTILN